MIIAKMGLLWCGGVLFLIEAAGHQIQYSSSWAFVPLITTALALLPPSRAFLSRLLGWKAPRTALIVLLIGGTGVSMMVMDEARRKDTVAVAKGFASDAEMTRAASFGLTSSADLSAHDAKEKVKAEEAAAKAAAEVAEAERKTPITKCENLPYSASIETFTNSQTTVVCREMLRVLEGVTVEDLKTFEKAVYLLSAKGYKTDAYKQIAAELVDIIRLRGLYDHEPRWKPTIEVVWKSFSAFNGVVTPADVELFLSSAGPMAKTLSDDGLLSMIIVMKRQYQRGE
ncbi:MAG: hypothetical protein WA384_13890 [Rhodomicrobium sp.]